MAADPLSYAIPKDFVLIDPENATDDRRFVRVLAAVSSDGLDAVEAAIREALDAGVASDEVILNILSRRREPPAVRALDVVVDLKLEHPPIADCARYDTVRDLHAAA